MIAKSITLSDKIIHITCLGNSHVPTNLTSQEISKIVNLFIGENLKVFFLEQEHKTRFYEITPNSTLPLQGDAFYTTETDLVLVIKTADCIPILFWSKEFPLIGAIHSGWRGTSQNILEKVCLHVIDRYNLNNLEFYFGPCIRQNQYEVGEDVAKIFMQGYPNSLKQNGNKYLFSNDFVVKKQIQALPIITKVEDSGICNFLDPRYYSHRRGDKSRNLNFIYMKRLE